MAFNFPSSSHAGFIPSIKYSARDGCIIRLDDVRENGAYVPHQTDITNGFGAIFDFDNIEVGYVMFQKGVAPDFHLVRLGVAYPPRPSEKHNPCIRFMLKLAMECAGDATPIRECVATAEIFRTTLDTLHDVFLAQGPAHPGKLPEVKLRGTVPVTTRYGATQFTNYKPIFEIIGWAARPDDLKFVPKGTAAL